MPTLAERYPGPAALPAHIPVFPLRGAILLPRASLRTESSVSALAHQYPMSFAAVQKHVTVLAAAGLVTKHRRGREQIVSTDIRALRTAAQLLDQLESIWRTRIDRLGDILAEPEGGAPQ